MAGTSPDFDATAFRAGIKFAQQMGATPVADDQVTFYFEPQLVYTGNVDAEGVPFDPATTVQRVDPPAVKATCAVEYDDAQTTPTNVGFITASRVRTILLDDEYQKVKGAIYITIGGDRYDYRRTEPPTGLFDVGIYVMHWVAENEQ